MGTKTVVSLTPVSAGNAARSAVTPFAKEPALHPVSSVVRVFVAATLLAWCGTGAGSPEPPRAEVPPGPSVGNRSLGQLALELDRAEKLYTAVVHVSGFEPEACERVCQASVLSCRARDGLESSRWEHSDDREWGRVTGRARDRCALMTGRCRQCVAAVGVP